MWKLRVWGAVVKAFMPLPLLPLLADLRCGSVAFATFGRLLADLVVGSFELRMFLGCVRTKGIGFSEGFWSMQGWASEQSLTVPNPQLSPRPRLLGFQHAPTNLLASLGHGICAMP